MRTNSILIVDDDEKLCALLKSYFEQEQFIVYIAHDGMTALHTLRNQKPQIMPPRVTDMASMQNMGKYTEKHGGR